MKTLAEFVDYVSSNPGTVSYGSAGPGSLTHLTMELFKQQTGTFHGAHPLPRHRAGLHRPARRPDAGHVPRPGRGAAAHPLGPRAPAGGDRHDSATRSCKDVPTLDESGFKGFDAQQWYGVVGPAGMPADVVKRLNDTRSRVLKAPDLREKLSVEAVEPMPMTPEQFGQFIRADIARWTALAQARNIQLDD